MAKLDDQPLKVQIKTRRKQLRKIEGKIYFHQKQIDDNPKMDTRFHASDVAALRWVVGLAVAEIKRMEKHLESQFCK